MELGDVLLARQRTVEAYDVIGSPPSPGLQALVDLTAQVVGAPMAAINLLTATEQHMAATSGIDPLVCSTEESMCAVVATDPGPVVVPDATVDARFSENPFVNGVLDEFRFYASAALVAPDGVPVGRLCVFDHQPRELDQHQRDALVTLAGRVMDILELRLRSRQLEASLVELTAVRDELQRSNHELDQFARQISHDLKTPLTGILANAELLAGEPVVQADGDLREAVDDIVLSGRRMDDLIGQVLAYAQEGGRLSFADVALGEVFGRAIDDMAPLIAESAAVVDLQELPRVRGDADLLYSVALNLLTNAVKFGRPGVPVRVCVSAEQRDDGVRVRVRDNGIGIPAEHGEDVFDLFVRGESEAEGHGIGLATVKRVVEAHEGHVGVEPGAGVGEGDGTTIWFELPS